MSDDSSRISPTAHYTSYVWYRAGLSHEAFATPLGRVLHAALRPANVGYERFGTRPSLDMMLLARHHVLDHILTREIEADRVHQVIEIAAGLSPRGWSFARKFPSITYVEGDLPEMAAEKRRRLQSFGLTSPRHHVVSVDALSDSGPDSLAAISEKLLDPTRGTAFITEGLLSYFSTADVLGMWRRFAGALRRFPLGVYLSDLHLSGDAAGMRGALAFRKLLRTFARGDVHLHFETEHEALDALHAAGFTEAQLHQPANFPGIGVPAPERRHVVRIVDARVRG